MKRLLILMMAALITLSSCSGWKQVPGNLEKLVEKIEKSGDDFSEKNWDKVRSEYYRLMDQYYEHKEQYSIEDSARIVKAAGKYHALMLKRGFKDAANYVNGLINNIPDYIDGISDGLEDSGEDVLDDLEDNVEDIVDKVEEGLDNLVDKFKSLF